MSAQFPLMVTSHSDKQIHIFDLSKVATQQYGPVHLTESCLKEATSAISCFGSGKGYAVGSIEGRCSIVNVDFSKIEDENSGDFCFKCHRKDIANTSYTTAAESEAWTVNAIAFNKAHDTFATCGSDGHWVIWNKDSRSRYKSSNKAALPITAACFSKDAQIFLHAHGEDWSQGAETSAQRQNVVKLFARHCDTQDVIKNKK